MFEHFDIDLTKASFEWDEENPFCCLCISGPECNQDDFRTAGNSVGEREV